MIDKGIAFLSIYDSESYALRILSAVLKQKGYLSYQIYFKRLHTPEFPYSEKEVGILIDLLVKLRVKLLALSLRSSSLKSFSGLEPIIRQRIPGIQILMGGTHATLVPDDALNYADAICIGDGEDTMLEVAQKYDGNIESLSGIKGIRLRDNYAQDTVFSLRGAFENLDSLPIEIYEDENKYFIEDNTIYQKEPLNGSSTVEVFASRGCPRQCAFCSNSILNGIITLKGQKYVRTRGVKSTIDSLLYLKRRFKNLRRIVFADEVFGLDKAWVDEFCKIYPKEIGLPFSALFYVSLINPETIEKLKEAGISHSRVGIQSGSEEIRKTLYKRIETNDQIIVAGKLFNKLKIRFTYDLIVNNPYETEDDKLKALKLLTQIPRPFELNLHSLVYFPNTVLTRKALSDKIIEPQEVEGKQTCNGLFLTDVLSVAKGNDVFWNSLFSLASKNFVSKRFLLWAAKNNFLKKRSRIVLVIAKLATIIKMLQIGLGLVIKREISIKDALKTLITMLGKPLTNK